MIDAETLEHRWANLDPMERNLMMEAIREKLIEIAKTEDFRDRPFPHHGEGSCRFWLWMLPGEFQLCFALSMAWLDRGELRDITVDEAVRAVVYRLAQEYEYEWAGLRVGDDNELYAKRKDILTPGCANWVVMAVFGMPLDYFTHVDGAVRMAEENARLRDLVPMLKETRARIQARYDREPEPDEDEKEFLRMKARFERDAIQSLETIH